VNYPLNLRAGQPAAPATRRRAAHISPAFDKTARASNTSQQTAAPRKVNSGTLAFVDRKTRTRNHGRPAA
jgi:hypothetical protein